MTAEQSQTEDDFSQKRTGAKKSPFICAQCGKSFTLKVNLNSHIRIHSGERNYSCLQCGSSFFKNADLKRHLQTHSGEKPFSCSHCSKSFTRKESNIQHHLAAP
ncbi:gastrula zinc finger protein XlCGF7.1-like [Sinocyclocheilus grahami]|uniref:gastrula zinc finger protein XlCGF7.1-like n=1 Tax=Sinocyclocheilus grahami TaxID=75366 RepID=UPI0007AD04B7|nr:PREDICTED: gastrula zinc finger protein XlCGF7.1-like [Sinocyclocheilus grahami]